ncbi:MULTISPECIES: FAD-binding oxidoreductase [unclassified Streptomyces]|uniref:FAD-binding oxidoreductase n=1 Tax=unclassified Streptomyces TaxID=2593676 RepID=UPI00225728E4|nr:MULTISPECIES: FAD-binding oxidoreductase [unclassified Streptomyces]MCX4549297.1 FAD-binding oxidoreductase [Streptomyces sp. NBC_01500]WSC20841.1 FAD-binding oxidoreductase [Streptomyces sp. NBC_01766]
MHRRTLLTAVPVLATAVACDSSGATGDNSPPGTTGGPATGTTSATGTTTTTAVPGPRTSAAADWTALARGLDGKLVRPGDADYPTARQLYNTRYDGLKPAAVAYVAGEADIRECLAYARAHGVPVSIRNGGHSYAGWSSGNGRLVVDVSKLSHVSADGTIGAGAKLADVYETLGRSSRAIPGGSCPTVGISGLTLGGGHGVASRAYGLTCDSLTSATLITADGTRLTANSKENKDLFWALRGAGNGNFGVVTELTFRTHPAPQTVSAYLSWPWSNARAVIDAWQRWGPEQADEIWSSAHLEAASGGATPGVTVAAFSLGTYGDLQNAVDRLADMAGASASSVSLRRHSYEEAMLAYAGCASVGADRCRLPGATPGRGVRGVLQRETYAAASDFYDRTVPAAGIDALLSRTQAFSRLSATTGSGAVALTALGGAINRVSPTATAFVHRRSQVLAQYIASWPPGTAGTAQQAWLTDIHTAMRPYVSGGAYQNYIDPKLTDWRKAYYGDAAPRLGQLKKQHDPDRLFDFPQAL